LADDVERPTIIPYAQLPDHPTTEVPGHEGELVLGWLNGVAVAVWRGRAHFYEGWSMADLAFPVRLLHVLGGTAVLLTNAAGGLSPDLASGDLMVFSDHIFLPGLAGHNPLRGLAATDERPRFVGLAEPYDPELRALAGQVAIREGIRMREGVYAMVAGPNYETRAEGELLRRLGADAVGMSTVPEVIVARQLGLKVVALSAITNMVLGPRATEATHDGVLTEIERIRPRLRRLVRGILGGMAEVLRS
jgi:purine-nucleoside phosphorylase